jgi:RNA polymerase sigma factor (sigma-70 family)
MKITKEITQELLDERELIRKFQQAILLLTKQRRTVFVLAKMEGWPGKKIARTLGISVCTVKVTLQKAIKDIQNYMALSKPAKRQLNSRSFFMKS